MWFTLANVFSVYGSLLPMPLKDKVHCCICLFGEMVHWRASMSAIRFTKILYLFSMAHFGQCKLEIEAHFCICVYGLRFTFTFVFMG